MRTEAEILKEIKEWESVEGMMHHLGIDGTRDNVVQSNIQTLKWVLGENNKRDVDSGAEGEEGQVVASGNPVLKDVDAGRAKLSSTTHKVREVSK